MTESNDSELWIDAENAFDNAHVKRLSKSANEGQESGCASLINWLEYLKTTSKIPTDARENRGHRIVHLYGLGGAGKTMLLNEVAQRADNDGVITCSVTLSKDDEVRRRGIRWTKLLSNNLDQVTHSIQKRLSSSNYAEDKGDLDLLESMIGYFSPAAQMTRTPKRSKLWPHLIFLVAIALLGISSIFSSATAPVIKLLFQLGGIAALLYPIYEFLYARQKDPAVQANGLKKRLRTMGLNIGNAPIFVGEDMDQWSEKREKEFEKILAATLSLILLRISSRNRSPVILLLDVQYLPAYADAIETSISGFIDSLQAWADDWQAGLHQDQWRPLNDFDVDVTTKPSFNSVRSRTRISEQSILGVLISHKMVSPFSDIAHTRIVVEPFTPVQQKRLYEQFMNLVGGRGRAIEKRLRHLQKSLKGKPEEKNESPPWPTNIVIGEMASRHNVLPRDIRLSTQAALTLGETSSAGLNHANLRNHFRAVWHSRAIDRLFPLECSFRNIVSTLARLPYFPGDLLDRFDLPQDFPDPRNNLAIKNNSWFHVIADSTDFGPLFAINRPIRAQLLTYRAHSVGTQHHLIVNFLMDFFKQPQHIFEPETQRLILCMALSTAASLVQGERMADAKLLLSKLDFTLLTDVKNQARSCDKILVNIAIYHEIEEIEKRLQCDLRLNWIRSSSSVSGADSDSTVQNILQICQSFIEANRRAIYRTPGNLAIARIKQQHNDIANKDEFWSSLEEFPEGPPWKTWPRYEIKRSNDGLESALKLLDELEELEDDSPVAQKVLLKFRESMIHRLERADFSDSEISRLRHKQVNTLKTLILKRQLEDYIENSFLARVIRTSRDSKFKEGEALLDILLKKLSEASERDFEKSIQIVARVAKRIANKLSPEKLCSHISNLLLRRRRNETTLAWHYVLFEYTNGLFVTFSENRSSISKPTLFRIQDCVAEYRALPTPSITLSTESSPWERHIGWAIEQTNALFDLWSSLFDGSGNYKYNDIARLAISSERVHRLDMLAFFSYWMIHESERGPTSAAMSSLADVLIFSSCTFQHKDITNSDNAHGNNSKYIQIENKNGVFPDKRLESIVESYISSFDSRSSVVSLHVSDVIYLVESLYEKAVSAIHEKPLVRWVSYRMMHFILVAFKVAKLKDSDGNSDAEALRRCIRLYAKVAADRNNSKIGSAREPLTTSAVEIGQVSAENASEVLVKSTAKQIAAATLSRDADRILTGDIVLVRCVDIRREPFPQVEVVGVSKASRTYKIDFIEGSDQESGFLPPMVASEWISWRKSESESDTNYIEETDSAELIDVPVPGKSWDGAMFCAVARSSAIVGGQVVLKGTARGASFVSAVSDAILPMGFIASFSPEAQLPWCFNSQNVGGQADRTDDFFMAGSNSTMVVPVTSETKGVLIGGDGSVLNAFRDICGLRRIALFDVPDIEETANLSTKSLRDSLDERYVRSLLNNFYEDLQLCTLGNPSLFSSPTAGCDPRKDRTFVALYRKFTGRNAVIVKKESAQVIKSVNAPAEYWDRVDLEWTHQVSCSEK